MRNRARAPVIKRIATIILPALLLVLAAAPVFSEAARKYSHDGFQRRIFYIPAGAPQADFHVAPDGRDTNPGRAKRPFATLARARDEVRKKVAAGLTHPVVVLIRGGTYSQDGTLAFGSEDSGTERHC